MVFAVLTSLSLVCLAAGLTLLGTSLTLSRRARRYQIGMQALLKLGNQGLEPLDIPAMAWPVLTGAGWQHLSIVGDWFGHPVDLSLGRPPSSPRGSSSKPPALVFGLRSGDDVALTLRLTHSAKRGEFRMFAEQQARVFVLLLETALQVRTGAISAALAERARLSLYLQHDMRNLAQWVGWVCADFEASADPADLLAAALRLQRNAPLAQERAQRLITALGKNTADSTPALIELAPAIERAAQLAGVTVILSGQARAWIANDLLARALDNLFSNLAPNWRNPHAAPAVLTLCNAPDAAQVTFFSPWPDDASQVAPEKLFEPFSSGRPGGLGLGLYQARKSLRQAGGDLRARPGPDGLQFVLRMPALQP